MAQPKDIDKLCPPRLETSAKFKKCSYQPPSRPFREAALKAFDYIMNLPDMTCLLETGKPYRLYQHNSYVSKTHAAHICYMIALSKEEPSYRSKALDMAAASAEYLLSELEPENACLAFWPPTYIRKPLDFYPETDGPLVKMSMIGNEPEAAVKYRGEVMLLYPANVGIAFIEYYKETGDQRFLDAASGIAGTYLKIRRDDGSWPLKMRMATAEVVGNNILVPNRVLYLFKGLADVTGDIEWRKAEYETFEWIERNSLSDWNWDGQFEDIEPAAKYKNPTKDNALDIMMYMMERFPSDRKRMAECRKILEFCEKRFVVWETPSNRPNWPSPSVLEQYSCFTPIDASAALLIRSYLVAYAQFRKKIYKDKAIALAGTITRMQQDNGRIPTFWGGLSTGSLISTPRYDWLNCMESSAYTLLSLSKVMNNI